MAVNEARSMNSDLQLGVRDGIVKTLTPDRGGLVELGAVKERAAQLQGQYNITSEMHPFNCGCVNCV